MYKQLKSVLFFVLLAPAATPAQELTLDEAYTLAEKNYPQVKQRDLLRKSGAWSLENIATGALPQLTIAGQASYQSEVTELPIKPPNVEITGIPKDQYKVYAEITQAISDLSVIRQQKQLQQANTDLQQQNLEVELYKLRERINQLYFGILLADEQLLQNELTKRDIRNGMGKVHAAIDNGTDFRSSLDKLKAELLKAEQKDIELIAMRKVYLDMLSMFLDRPLTASTTLKRPAAVTLSTEINRPEQRAFRANEKVLDIQNRLLHSNTLPKFSFFLQGGAGNPALNMLRNEWRAYYIGGVRLNWSISRHYTYKRDKQLIGINREMIGNQEEIFLWNTRLQLKQQYAEISRLQDLLASDEAIVQLRTSIKNAASAQLENGVISVNDYLKEVTNEEAARQMVALHSIQLLLAQHSSRTTTGF
jgi:outer membrane protein TolC